jgi:hypothetical protein
MFEKTAFTVVGLAGGAGVGKDTLANKYFRPMGFYPIAFADEIKIRVVASGKATFDETYITKPPEIRTFLQEEGTERGRDLYGENVWVDQLLTRVEFFNRRWGFNKFVVTDVRFPSEVKGIQAVGGKVFQIVAPERYAANGMSNEARQHRSETSLNDFTGFDGRIMNDPKDAETVLGQITRLVGSANTPSLGRFDGVRFG